MSEFEQEVVEYVKTFYQKKGKTPSINQIIKNVKNCRQSKLYRSFMGIEDICSKAEIPYPKDRIEKIKNLNKNNVKSNSSKKSKNNEDSDIKLTKNQIFRINTISHLEKGKN